MRKIFFLLSIFYFLFFTFLTVRAAQPELYCFFDQALNFNCQKDFVSGARKMTVIEKEGLIDLLTPANLGLDADQYKIFILRPKINTDYPILRINILEERTGIWPLSDLEFSFNNYFSQYYFDLSQSVAWRGKINKIYLQINPGVEIESFKIVKKSAPAFLKTIWQEFLTFQPERFFWINILPTITVGGISILKYLFIFISIIIFVLVIFKIRDKTLRKHWSKIILTIFFIAWFVVEARMIYENINWLKRDIVNLRNLSQDQKREILISQMVSQSKFGSDLYAYLDFVKNKIPAEAKVFLFGSSDYPYILLTYHLVERFQLTRRAEWADYFLIYNLQPEDSSLIEFEPLAAFGPGRLIFKRK